MYTFIDNWYGDSFSFPTLRAAKKEAKNHTCGHSIAIYHNGDIVAIVKPNERLEKPCVRDPRSPVPLTLAVQNSLTL